MAQVAQQDRNNYHEDQETEGDGLLLERYPETEDEAKLVEESLANAMAKLSVDEEDRLLFDMYGFPSGLDEEPNSSLTTDAAGNIINSHDSSALLKSNEQNEALSQLQDALQSRWKNNVPENVWKTYERAVEANPLFLQQQGPLFLAAVREGTRDNFNAAAKLLLDNLEVKSELFPEDVLPRHVRWTDLTEREQEVVSYGCYQFAKAPDALGRIVFHWSAHRAIEIWEQGKDPDLGRVFSRTLWYTLMSCLRSNSNALERGVVLAMCSITSKTIPIDINKVCIRMFWRLPFRFQCGHIFHTNPGMHIRFKALQLLNIFFTGSKCVRIYVHLLSSIPEIKDKMMSVGLDPAASPWADCCDTVQDWSRKNHLDWIGRQKNREHVELMGSSLGLALVTPEIQPLDVLLGRSRRCSEHVGTKRCKVLVALQQEGYESCRSTQGKTQIANGIVEAIRKSGGRFLRYENEQWKEVSLTIARQKVAHYFRFLRSKGREN